MCCQFANAIEWTVQRDKHATSYRRLSPTPLERFCCGRVLMQQKFHGKGCAHHKCKRNESLGMCHRNVYIYTRICGYYMYVDVCCEKQRWNTCRKTKLICCERKAAYDRPNYSHTSVCQCLYIHMYLYIYTSRLALVTAGCGHAIGGS